MNRSNAPFGFVLGIFFPILGLIVVYLIKFSGAGLGNFFEVLFNNHETAALLLSFSLFANLIPFIYYTNKRLDATAKGILIATMLYALLIVLLKYVWH
ncbi:MAG TPA: hypothetical protein VL098_13420 [Flavipsychrobacter sp.]|nr:hypothetical protein [Flavipsychrobacter sp.]